ncbi:MAG: methyltransferase domain-containing protein [Saprospiraceae bacterium]
MHIDKTTSVQDTFNRVAQEYQDKLMDLDLYNDGYETFCQLVSRPNARIFEIGCGPGNITRYILNKRPDYAVTGIDLAANMLKLAKKNNPNVNFKVMDCREIDRIREKFDGIICGFCLPYLSETEGLKLIADCFNLLNPGGIFYLSTIEGDYAQSKLETSSNGQHKVFMYYYPEAYLKRALLENNFEVLEVYRKLYGLTNGPDDTHLIFIARKK